MSSYKLIDLVDLEGPVRLELVFHKKWVSTFYSAVKKPKYDGNKLKTIVPLVIKVPPLGGQTHPCQPPRPPETSLIWTSVVAQFPPTLSL